jgi:aldose 1-epimerase
MTLRLTNTGAQDQPVGLGWHPYFLRRPGSRLKMAVTSRWNHDALQIPTEAVPQAGIDAEVASLAVDHCFGGWTGAARITDDDFTLRLTSSLAYAVIFTPAGKPHFCVEPVSHVNDAIHFPDPLAQGLRLLRPGESTEAMMRLQIEAAR